MKTTKTPPKEKPLNVSIGFDNFEILKIDDRDFSIEINAYLIVKWKDSRLLVDSEQFEGVPTPPPPSDTNEEEADEESWLPVELEVVDKIWLPDSEILRLKGFHSLAVLDRLQGLWMNVRSEFLYVIATRIRFMCPMNYHKFPMDVQTCKFQVRSNRKAIKRRKVFRSR